MIKRFRYQIAIFLSVIGPGLITANVDNDSGGILTYSQAGAKYGYLPLWTLIPITLLLIVTQEMSSRMGAAPAKALSVPSPGNSVFGPHSFWLSRWCPRSSRM